jgi:acetyl esterase/lipase
MKSIAFCLGMLLCLSSVQAQRKIIQLYKGPAPGSETWNWTEERIDSTIWNTAIVYNVVHPSLTVYMPDGSAPKTNTAIIICPGGGFHALSINNEGEEVAAWLTKKGFTCFVLKYRLVHSLTNDPIEEWRKGFGTKEQAERDSLMIPLSVADGKTAIAYVRQHAAEYNVSPDRIGILGFSAGGAVTTASAFNYTKENRPDFVAPIYAYIPAYLEGTIAPDAPPLFLAAASDDQFGLLMTSMDLYSKWIASKHIAELHLYAKGGHGFGMHVQHMPVDEWIERFADWLKQQGFMHP